MLKPRCIVSTLNPPHPSRLSLARSVMANSESEANSTRASNSKKKRKLKHPEEEEVVKRSKVQRVDVPEEAKGLAEVEETSFELEEGHPWTNLQLILSLQSKTIDVQKKLELAFNFVKANGEDWCEDAEQDHETVKLSRLIVFLNDWIQSLLISSGKKSKVEDSSDSGVDCSWLNLKCWDVFKFCLENSSRLRVPLNVSRNLLQPISFVAKHALSRLTDASLPQKKSFLDGELFELYIIVVDCLSLIFLSHECLSNENLEMWISTVHSVLEISSRILVENFEEGKTGVLVLQFSCKVLEPFAKFLRIHPTRKAGFAQFVDRLVEPLLQLLCFLRQHNDESKSCLKSNLLKLVEEVLSYGLFHSIHIDGFLNLHTTDKYLASHDGRSKDSRTFIKSYHRHLFEKVEKIVDAGKLMGRSGIGELFHLLVDRVRKHKVSAVLPEGAKGLVNTRVSVQSEDGASMDKARSLSLTSNELQHNSYHLKLNPEAQKSLFDFFVQIMEPFLVKLESYVQGQMDFGNTSEIYGMLSCVNSLLSSFIHEKIYNKTEDISGGTCFGFLKKVYDAIISLSTQLNQIWLSKEHASVGMHVKGLATVAEELVAAVGFLLEIEYEVIGNDLINLWNLVLSHLAMGVKFSNSTHESSLINKTILLGCHLINLYRELRQVNHIIFALCKAGRLSVTCENDHESGPQHVLGFTTLSPEVYVTSVGTLVCSQQFKLAVSNAISSVPEGQASGYIKQLAEDVSESLKWLKQGSPTDAGKAYGEMNNLNVSMSIDLRCELLGKGLSEIYCLGLDSLLATSSNSSSIGSSIKDLMTVIRPNLNVLVGLSSGNISEFLFCLIGCNSYKDLDLGKSDEHGKMAKAYQKASNWVLVFFFRLYMSCRSLYRQIICLMPPNSAKKVSDFIGDMLTTYSGKDLIDKTDWTDEGYFSWIETSSASLLTVVQSISDTYLNSSIEDSYTLAYVLHAMALQRLDDLNRRIKSAEYILESNEFILQTELLDGAAQSAQKKKCKKWGKRISKLKQEAAGLTEFLMQYLSLVAKDHSFSSNDANGSKSYTWIRLESGWWDFGISTVNEKSFHTAIWWIICQSVDIWSFHAAKKKLKMFLSLLLHSSLVSLPFTSGSLSDVGNRSLEKPLEVSMQHVSLELLGDSTLYEHSFVRRHFSSVFCHLLEEKTEELIGAALSAEIDLSVSPNWNEVLVALEKSVEVLRGSQLTICEPISHSLNTMQLDDHGEEEACHTVAKKFSACQNLLRFLCWMPKGYLNDRSFKLCTTYILNIERLTVSNLLNCQGPSQSHDHYELLKFFLSCRKAIKHITVASCDEKRGARHSSLNPILEEGALPLAWLVKSVYFVLGLQDAWAYEGFDQLMDIVFSLKDHTSSIFLMSCQYKSSQEVQLCMDANSFSEQDYDEHQRQKNQVLSDSCCDSSTCESMSIVAQSIKEEMQRLHGTFRDSSSPRKADFGDNSLYLSKLSYLASCLSGSLWGLASSLRGFKTAGGDHKAGRKGWMKQCGSKLNPILDIFAEIVNFQLNMLVVNVIPHEMSGREGSDHEKKLKGVVKTFLESSEIVDGHLIASTDSQDPQVEDGDGAATNSTEDCTHNFRSVNEPLLQLLLKGDNRDAAFLLRHLFIGYSAILRLNCVKDAACLSLSVLNKFMAVASSLIWELVHSVQMPHPFVLVSFDGVLKFLEELGNRFPATDPTLARRMYARIIELHLEALGKCISLQGKRYTLISHEKESSTKMLQGHLRSSEASYSHSSFCLEEFTSRLRRSFIVFIENPAELHLLSAVQAIERALLGVHGGCTAIYDISTGSSDGGTTSSFVAAGIDCLDLLLENTSGRQRLSVVRKHIHNLIAGLFNIILHIQSPSVFYERSIQKESVSDPDPGSVILMCIEVLTRVSGKHTLFEMDPSHVAQSLQLPATLFQYFNQLQHANSGHLRIVEGLHDNLEVKLDRQFSIELYAACCRLLHTVLKHHKGESEKCIALLQDSASILLSNLETVESGSVSRKGLFSWDIQGGIRCASALRRIYEEMRQQKDVFGPHCFKFLSSYIWTYSGCGPLKRGIKREIDEALRPGIYALVDACSADDLQYLHTVFGEGPCRSALSTLQHDYKLNFQYGGKV